MIYILWHYYLHRRHKLSDHHISNLAGSSAHGNCGVGADDGSRGGDGGAVEIALLCGGNSSCRSVDGARDGNGGCSHDSSGGLMWQQHCQRQ